MEGSSRVSVKEKVWAFSDWGPGNGSAPDRPVFQPSPDAHVRLE